MTIDLYEGVAIDLPPVYEDMTIVLTSEDMAFDILPFFEDMIVRLHPFCVDISIGLTMSIMTCI